MHLDTEQIERLLHRELDPAQEAALRSHLRACPDCERRLQQAAREEEEIFAALGHLDHPAPSVTVDALMGRAPIRRGHWQRIAAGIVLVLAASGALYAAPGSPLPDLFGDVRQWLGAPAAEEARAVAEYATGLSVAPGATLDVVFAAPQAIGVVTVRVVDDPEITVRAIGEPVSFDLGVERVTVANRGARANYEILLPRDAPSIRVLIGDSVRLHRESGRIDSPVKPDATGAYRLPMTLGNG